MELQILKLRQTFKWNVRQIQNSLENQSKQNKVKKPKIMLEPSPVEGEMKLVF